MREADSILSELEALWPTLNERLSESALQLGRAQTQLEQLRAALTLWQQSSDEWEQASLDSRASLARVRRLLDELTRRYAVLSRAWSDYRREVQRQADLRERTVKAWRAVAILGPVIAGGLGWLLGVLLSPG